MTKKRPSSHVTGIKKISAPVNNESSSTKNYISESELLTVDNLAAEIEIAAARTKINIIML